MEKLVFFSLFLSVFVLGTESTKFVFINRCSYTVWPGTLNNAEKPQLPQTGFKLDSGGVVEMEAPAQWGGRMWGRSGCSTHTDGRFTCPTADCGSGVVACNGAGAVPPATLVEFTLQGDGGKDFYDTSLVDGFNLPMSITPQGGSGDCKMCGCEADVNAICPAELLVTGSGGSRIACKSACLEFNTDHYCCRGEFNSPDKCKDTTYSRFFKKACPTAYSYAYNDGTSTFTCTGANYLITFCP